MCASIDQASAALGSDVGPLYGGQMNFKKAKTIIVVDKKGTFAELRVDDMIFCGTASLLTV